MKPKPLKIRSVTIGGRQPAFILGPCVIESEKFVWRMARRLAEICRAESVPFIFKASYDKANRTSIRSYRGIGVREGCEILAAIGAELKVPVTTDVHSPAEAEIAGETIDVLQIPAFLCRQTDLLRAAAETGRIVNVKKGQFLAPWDVKNIAEKLSSFGNDKFVFTERGTSFGYNNLVADFRSLYWMREAGYRVIFDETALAFDYPTALASEFRRKVRTLAGVYQIVGFYPALLGPRNRTWIHFCSHKLARLLMPWALVAALFSTYFLPAPWGTVAFATQAAAYLLALADMVLPPDFPLRRLTAPLRTFTVLMAASLCALAILFVPARMLWKETRVSGQQAVSAGSKQSGG